MIPVICSASLKCVRHADRLLSGRGIDHEQDFLRFQEISQLP